ncbi:MAG: glycosyl hydrolase family 43 [Deltaproteobacteria bacterium]|nr:glycosyl hydrolase family 43 [Deltaproteobacteria bacterium]
MTVDEFTRLVWRGVDDAPPVLTPPLGSPLIADPTFLLPHETPDGRWHLFAHSIFGVHGFTSDDGVRWSRPRLAVRHAMRPYLLRAEGLYHLFYERYPVFRLPLAAIPGMRWRSWIEHRSSADLRHWSRPAVALAPSLGWHRAQGRGASVGNPTVVRGERGWRLHYSAGLVRVPDCGFDEPLHLGIAHGETIAGPYLSEPRPVLSPSRADPRANLGAGAMRVLRLADGFVGLQNGIAWDASARRSSSAISVRRSADGRRWEYAHPEPIVAPTTGWRARFVYACDARRAANGRWHLYFNGRDRAPLLAGREAIGFVVADPT